jgi:uncharacterized membrane protein
MLGRLRTYFFAGVLVTAPVAITAYIAWLVIGFIDDKAERLLPDAYLPYAIPGFGLVIAALILTTVGAFAAGLIGRAVLGFGESLVARMPVIRSIYAAVKQIFETILAQRSTTFRSVVLIEFPRLGLWRIGFVTGTTPGRTQSVHPQGLVNVFIPATPNITAGFLVMAPQNELIELEITTEEALKLVVSGGIASPTAEQLAMRRGAQPDRINDTAASRSNK